MSLALANVVATVLYVLSLPAYGAIMTDMSFGEYMAFQGDALQCFVGSAPISDDCHPNAGLTLIWFCLAYGGYVVCTAELLQSEDAVRFPLDVLERQAAVRGSQPFRLASSWYHSLGTLAIVVQHRCLRAFWSRW